jgi:hypothetical protein
LETRGAKAIPIFGHVKPFHLTGLGFLPCFDLSREKGEVH